MDLLKLDVPSYLPTGLGNGLQLVEGWRSCIWTERYLEPGDFQLKTPRIEDTMKWLPLGSMVSLRDTDEVMIVETYEIGSGSEGTELTVSGRSIDFFSENRILGGRLGDAGSKKYRMARDYTAAQAASVVLWNIFVNDTEIDVTHISTTVAKTARTALPNVVISDSTTTAGFLDQRFLAPGEAYPEIIKFLHWNRLGIRGIRPVSDPAAIVKVSTTGNGLITYTNVDTIGRTDALRFDLYNGVDRSLEQTSRNRVVFREDANQLDDPTYLISTKGSKTTMYVTANGQMYDPVVYKDSTAGPFGWERRDGWMDVGDPDNLDGSYNSALNDAGRDFLAKNGEKRIFDGKTTAKTPYVYKKHYGLGDKVSLMGNYGISMTMRVTEHIRSQERNKLETGYPTLEVAD